MIKYTVSPVYFLWLLLVASYGEGAVSPPPPHLASSPLSLPNPPQLTAGLSEPRLLSTLSWQAGVRSRQQESDTDKFLIGCFACPPLN